MQAKRSAAKAQQAQQLKAHGNDLYAAQRYKEVCYINSIIHNDLILYCLSLRTRVPLYVLG